MVEAESAPPDQTAAAHLGRSGPSRQMEGKKVFPARTAGKAGGDAGTSSDEGTAPTPPRWQNAQSAWKDEAGPPLGSLLSEA